MTTALATHPSLVRAIWPRSSWLRDLLVIVAGTGLLALSARLEVPLWPVPMTMQTFAVLVIAMTYGLRLGVSTVALYLIEGALGLPVLAGGAGGPAHFVGPTAGYLFGFVLAAGVMGILAERGWDRSMRRALVAMVLGTIVIFLCGVLWLTIYLAATGSEGPGAALAGALSGGVVPFLPGAVLKIILAAATLSLGWRLLDKRRL